MQSRHRNDGLTLWSLFLCLKSLEAKLEDLERKIFDAYIDRKGLPLVAALEPGMSAGGFKWYNCLPPQGESGTRAEVGPFGYHPKIAELRWFHQPGPELELTI